MPQRNSSLIAAVSIVLLLATLMGVLASGCSEPHLYESEVSIPEGQWHYSDTIAFRFDIADTSKLYTISLELTHGVDFPYQNLYVKFYTTFPSGKTEDRLVSLELTEKGAVWVGKCSGKRCTVRIPLQVKTWFPEPGTYILKLEQFMRVDPVPAVYSFKLMVDEWKERKSQ